MGFSVFLILFISLSFNLYRSFKIISWKHVQKVDNKFSSFCYKDGQFASKWLIYKLNLVHRSWPQKWFTSFFGKASTLIFDRELQRYQPKPRAGICLWVLVNHNLILILTTISPPSFVGSVQWTPQLVVTNFGTGIVCYSFVSKRKTAAFAIRRLCLAFNFCQRQIKVTTKLERSFFERNDFVIISKAPTLPF